MHGLTLSAEARLLRYAGISRQTPRHCNSCQRRKRKQQRGGNPEPHPDQIAGESTLEKREQGTRRLVAQQGEPTDGADEVVQRQRGRVLLDQADGVVQDGGARVVAQATQRKEQRADLLGPPGGP